VKITKKQLQYLIEAALTLSPEEVESAKTAVAGAIDSPDGTTPDEEAKAFADAIEKDMQTESLEKLPIYKKYSYGLDDIPDAGKAEDDIIGHT
jgi:hypothetical protein